MKTLILITITGYFLSGCATAPPPTPIIQIDQEKLAKQIAVELELIQRTEKAKQEWARHEFQRKLRELKETGEYSETD